MNKTIEQKQTLLENFKVELKSNHTKLISLLSSNYPDYTISANASWDEVIIKIRHTEYQWTDFATCNINANFEFSHASGGWDSKLNLPFETKLEKTKELFEIIQFISDNKAEIWEIGKVILKIKSDFADTKREIQDEIKEATLTRAKIEILENFSKVEDFEVLLKTIDDGGTINLYTINVRDGQWTPSKQVLQNKGMTKKSYYYQDNHVTLTYIKSFSTYNEFYIAKV